MTDSLNTYLQDLLERLSVLVNQVDRACLFAHVSAVL